MTSPRHDDHDNPERDAWLAEALRHAPDAEAAPPTAVREAILSEARAATAGTRAVAAPGTTHWLLAAWSWLARPPVAAGFASVMVATLIGLMWWDRPIDEALQRPSMPTPAPMPRVEQPAVAPTADAVALSPTPPALPAVPPVRADRSAARATAKPAAPPTQASPPRAEPAPFGDEPKSVAAAPAAEIAAGAQGAAAPTLRMRESTPPATVARDDSAAPSASPSARAFAKASPAPSTSGALASAQRNDEAATPAVSLTALLSSVAEQPQRWSWQRGGSSAQPMSPALQRWLQQLDRAAALQWRAPAGAPSPDEGSSVLRLYRDNAPYATLQLDNDAVWFVPASPTARPARASLPATALADLKRALAEATP